MIIPITVTYGAGSRTKQVLAKADIPKGYVETEEDAEKVGKAVEAAVLMEILHRG